MNLDTYTPTRNVSSRLLLCKVYITSGKFNIGITIGGTVRCRVLTGKQTKIEFILCWLLPSYSIIYSSYITALLNFKGNENVNMPSRINSLSFLVSSKLLYLLMPSRDIWKDDEDD